MEEGLSLLETVLEEYPRPLVLESGLRCSLRPLQASDAEAFWEFFQAVPRQELMFIKHHVHRREVIDAWCNDIDLGRNLPLLAMDGDGILAACTLHQQLGGWKRHIGRLSVLVHPARRGRGLAGTLVGEMIDISRRIGLEKLEAEFFTDQERGMKIFALLGFSELARLERYVRDMQAITHDYVLMGMDLTTDEEYAGVG